MENKNEDQVISGASIMANVWEIRLKEYSQKINCETERLEKSALEKINYDWAKRIVGKIKPKTMERRTKPPEELFSQPYKPKQGSLDKLSGFKDDLQHTIDNLKHELTKRNTLKLFSKLNKKHPELKTWIKSWEICKPLQVEQMNNASDWGHSWKLLNLQPDNEGKSWRQHEHDVHDNATPSATYSLCDKLDKTLFCQQIKEDMSMPDWETSWKYSKPNKEYHSSGRTGAKNVEISKPETLQESHFYEFSSQWNESWVSVKPPKKEPVQPASNFENQANIKNNYVKSGVPWVESWRFYKQQFHIKAGSGPAGLAPSWLDSWRVSNTNSHFLQQANRSITSDTYIVLPAEPLDTDFYRTIINASENIKNKSIYVGSQYNTGYLPLSVIEWQRSWLATKNLSEYKEQSVMKCTEDKQNLTMGGKTVMKQMEFELLFSPKMYKPAEMLKISKSKQKETLQSVWKESWKSSKHQPKQEKLSRCQIMPLITEKCCALHELKILFEPQRFHSQDWSKSWRVRSLDKKKHPNFGITHLMTVNPQQTWDNSWLLSTTLDFQNELTQSSITVNLQHYESYPEWGRSWKISNPQPPKNIALWVEAKFAPFADHMILWSRNNYNKQKMPTDFTRNYPSLKSWVQAWQFIKLESMVNIKSAVMKCNLQEGAAIKDKRQRKKELLDKTAPQVKGWTDAFKVAKSQPNQRRTSRLNSRQDKGEIKFAEWVESWKFTFESMNVQPLKITEWKESWKFLLKPHPSQNCQKKSKSNT